MWALLCVHMHRQTNTKGMNTMSVVLIVWNLEWKKKLNILQDDGQLRLSHQNSSLVSCISKPLVGVSIDKGTMGTPGILKRVKKPWKAPTSALPRCEWMQWGRGQKKLDLPQPRYSWSHLPHRLALELSPDLHQHGEGAGPPWHSPGWGTRDCNTPVSFWPLP